LTFVLAQTIFAAGDEKWREVTASEREMKTAQVEAGADAEAIFWEVSVADSYVPRAGFKTVLNHYLRIKIFTERGRENNSKVDIPFGKLSDLGVNVSIMDIAARTIKPDGTIVELKPGDIFERDIVRAGGAKLKAKSFAVPGIETGAIVEYRWKEVRSDSLSFYVRLHLSREIPVQQVKYSIKPFISPDFRYGMRIHSFNVSSRVKPDENGFYSMTMTGVKAFQEEPRMPSEFAVRPWMLIYYTDYDNESVDKYWKDRAKNTFEYHKSLLKPNDEIRKTALTVAGDATATEEKIRRIFDFCRRSIKNVDDDASGLTSEQRENFKANRTIADVLKKRAGDWHDINMLFGAMLMSIGLDARVANVALRSDANFNREFANDHFVRTENIAVKIGDEWKFYDPATSYVPFGMLFWSEEGQTALVSDPSETIWATMPKSGPDKSVQKRTAHLRLAEDGTLSGDVRIEYTGHLAEYYKEFNDDDAPAEREKTLVDAIRKDISSRAEVSEIAVENVLDPDKPFAYSFKINLPNYAERTGKRVFLRPNVFERDTNALFRTTERKYDISFEYAWSEEDDITIEIPAGFTVESVEAPRAVRDNLGLSSHETKISLSDDKRTLSYERRFSFGKSGELVFAAGNYPFIKQLFEAFQKAEAHIVSFRQD
jgi:hypothetical protein